MSTTKRTKKSRSKSKRESVVTKTDEKLLQKVLYAKVTDLEKLTMNLVEVVENIESFLAQETGQKSETSLGTDKGFTHKLDHYRCHKCGVDFEKIHLLNCEVYKCPMLNL